MRVGKHFYSHLETLGFCFGRKDNGKNQTSAILVWQDKTRNNVMKKSSSCQEMNQMNDNEEVVVAP